MEKIEIKTVTEEVKCSDENGLAKSYKNLDDKANEVIKRQQTKGRFYRSVQDVALTGPQNMIFLLARVLTFEY